jgi:small subunit ribosomal protein S14
MLGPSVWSSFIDGLMAQQEQPEIRRKISFRAKKILPFWFLYLPSVFLMAKTSWLERDKRKRATVAKWAELRAELKAKKDYIGLSQLPRNASPVRLTNRCVMTGRRRAFMGRFKLSRITFRELATNGLIPGVTKSSW